VADLLESVDGLHRSLNDERYNSSQLEATIAELRRELVEKEAERGGGREELEGRVAELEGELGELIGQLEEALKEKEEMAGVHATMEAEWRGRAEEEAAALRARIAELEAAEKETEGSSRHEGEVSALMLQMEEMVKEREVLLDARAKVEGELVEAGNMMEEAIKQRDRADKEAADAAVQVADLQKRVLELEASLESKQHEKDDERDAEKYAAVAKDVSILKAENVALQSQLQAAQARLASLQSLEASVSQKDAQLASMASDMERVRENLAAEKRRSAQLEQLASSAGNKKLDDDQDMEAAALSGGSATFKPLVGFVRSLPPAVGNNHFMTETAKKLDKAFVALDARPAIRAAVIGYILLLHVILLI